MSKGTPHGSLPGAVRQATPAPASPAGTGRSVRAEAALVQQKSAPPIPSGLSVEAPILPSRALVRAALPGVLDVSVILGTVNRPQMLTACIAAVRASLTGLTYEIVVAYGHKDEPALPWLRAQPDVVPVLGGMDGAIPAFNAAYAASRGLLVCQINDDVVVDLGSIQRAVAHLDAVPECAAVVFRFDRGDGQGLHHEYLAPGKLHPNQMVARRATCEAVIAHLGAFWGDALHRTHKTYGGDSAFGVLCHHLGLRLDSVEGVTCRDRQNEAHDDLRRKNQPPPGHGDRWRAVFQPYLTSTAKKREPDPGRWERLYALDPALGRFPEQEAPGRERVLHVHLKTPDDPQLGLVRALQALGDYAQVDWPTAHKRGTLAKEILGLGNRLRPTLVFMQLQTPHVLGPDVVAALLPLLAPRGLIATWCGDVAHHNSPWTVGWQVPLGQAVDLTLHSSFTHVKALRQAGIPGAAYLQIGYDPEQYRPAPGVERTGGVCFLGNRYYSAEYLTSLQQHDAALRDAVLGAMQKALGPAFALYGSGQPSGRGALPLFRAHEAYQRAQIGLNVSLCNFFEAYSSDRIFRILGCGALLLTKRFPLISTYGLVHGENCLVWDTPKEAVALAQAYLGEERRAERERIAAAGQKLAAERHTWGVRMRELSALLTAVRGTP